MFCHVAGIQDAQLRGVLCLALTCSVLLQVTENRWHRFYRSGRRVSRTGSRMLVATALVSAAVVWRRGGVNACTRPDAVYVYAL